MTFKVKLVRTWEMLILTMIFVVSLLLMSLHFIGNQTNVVVVIIIFFPIFFGSIIASTLLATRMKTIEIKGSVIYIGDSISIPIDQIKICRTGKSFLIDGLIIKMQNNKTHYFHSLAIFKSNPNFQLFQNALFNKSFDKLSVPVETKEDFLKRSKFLRYGSRLLLILLISMFILSYVIDYKIDKLQFLYLTLISLGMVISTRK